MSITLLAAQNPKWVTLKKPTLDENGQPQVDSNGDMILEDQVDSNGNKIKAINIETKWSHLGGTDQPWVTHTATSFDTAEHGKNLYDAIMNGDHGTIAEE